ncbi:SPP1 gp7 family phage head morphogenesis protein [Striga asiatica]|uniref:SPP1 gp7 family phage head morphogenesis protein n=1 Tax=Striga asiatica TaxID=4170 RepID=A0A5A7R294_STRAF|nr:SPP1 gp7 family phage head morphogenesis protein [Striga asiatica]
MWAFTKNMNDIFKHMTTERTASIRRQTPLGEVEIGLLFREVYEGSDKTYLTEPRISQLKKRRESSRRPGSKQARQTNRIVSSGKWQAKREQGLYSPIQALLLELPSREATIALGLGKSAKSVRGSLAGCPKGKPQQATGTVGVCLAKEGE